MAKTVYYWFEFEDGYCVACRGFSRNELKIEERKHGKLISKTLAETERGC